MIRRLTITLMAVCTASSALAGPNDPFIGSTGSWGQDFADQWALQTLRVYADIAPAQPAPDTPVVVAVIDTGIDYLHEDIAAERLWRNNNERPNHRDDDGNGLVDDLIGWDFVNDGNNPWDQSGHGTHVAGIIGACTDNGVGIGAVARHVRLMPLKVANFIGQARSSAVAAAITYAVDHGARIINLSLGGELITEAEKQAAMHAAANDVLIVVSAGNQGLTADRFGYPGLPDVMVVGASDRSGDRAGFSNFGTLVEVLAPGVDVLSLRARDTDFIALSQPADYPPGGAFVGAGQAYYRATGTSFAAAMVSGMAAALLTARPDLSIQAVRRLLAQNAVDIGAPGADQRTGYGRVDFVRAAAGDPSTFIAARIEAVDLELVDQTLWFHIIGSADAARFATANVEVRARPGTRIVEPPEPRSQRKREPRAEAAVAGTDPEWQPLTPPLATPVSHGRLASVTLDSLRDRSGGATAWELRLQVTDAGGTQRESQFAMALPAPLRSPETSQ